MRTVPVSAFSLSLLTLLVTLFPSPPKKRSEQDLQKWLADHHLAPKPKSSREELLEMVQTNWDAVNAQAYAAGHSAQKVFGNAQQNVVENWSDSQLRQFLLEKGIVKPASKREELVLLAHEYGAGAQHAFDSAVNSASNSLSAAWYATTDAPRLAYDYTSQRLDNARDYVFSSWCEFECS